MSWTRPRITKPLFFSVIAGFIVAGIVLTPLLINGVVPPFVGWILAIGTLIWSTLDPRSPRARPHDRRRTEPRA